MATGLEPGPGSQQRCWLHSRIGIPSSTQSCMNTFAVEVTEGVNSQSHVYSAAANRSGFSRGPAKLKREQMQRHVCLAGVAVTKETM